MKPFSLPLAEPLGLYVHVPFCRDRCTYCSFVTTRDLSPMPQVLGRLLQELKDWGGALDRCPVDTLYLGGGTPSVLPLEALESLVAGARGAFNLSSLAEATLEANPGTVDLAWLEGARRLGLDRLSLGIQTLDDALLARLGRIHDGDTGLQAISLAKRAGFERITADLMVGIPGQRLDRVLQDAESLVDAGCEHLSVYLLDLDKACPLKAAVDAGRLCLPPEDEVADVFEALQAHLPRMGLHPYEISNYARPGKESLHNSRYWLRRPYLGLGPSAASHLGNLRWTEGSSITAWAEGRVDPEVQELDEAEALAEIPLLGFRRHEGVRWEGLREQAVARNLLPLVESWEVALQPCFTAGLIERWEGCWRLTPKGMLLGNQVFQVFV